MQLEAGHLLGDPLHVVSFIHDNDCVLIVDLEVLPNLRVYQVVVRHQYQIGVLDTSLLQVVWTYYTCLPYFVEILNI